MQYKGSYNDSLMYSPGDVVSLDGSAFVARKMTQSIRPGSDSSSWGLLASRGENGNNGEIGRSGEDGQNGVGVPEGGFAGYVLAKETDSDYKTYWKQVDVSTLGAAPQHHSHLSSEISDIDALIQTRAAASHAHSMSDIDGLELALAGKSVASHKHSAEDIVSGALKVDSVDAGSVVVDGMIINESVISTDSRLTIHVDGVDSISIIRDFIKMNTALHVRSIRLIDMNAPASSSAAGEPGDLCWDQSYLYLCVQKNNWKRTPLSSW